MLEVKDLVKEFKNGDDKVKAVSGISFTVPEGQFASIIGRSGSGKSTLLTLLGGLEKPTSGEVLVGGKDITKMHGHDQVEYRSKEIGFVFQSYNLIPNLSALENVMIAMEFTGVPVAEQKERAADLLEEVGIEASKHRRRPGKLSGGEQQRVAIARALANRPKLILADEPTGNLDSQTGKLIFDLLHQLSRKEKTTIVAVTHDLQVAGKTDLTFKIDDGKLVK